MDMNLCLLCQGFDIRTLLFESFYQKALPFSPHQPNESFRAEIPRFHKHHASLVALKRSAENGSCNVCRLLWETCSEVRKLKADVTDEWLDHHFPGQLYIGSTNWSTDNQGYPYVALNQQTPDGPSRTLCSFEAFTDQDTLPEKERTLLGRTVYPDSSSPECMSVASEWLHTCLKDHNQCVTSDYKAVLPRRLIDVGHDVCHPKQVDTPEKPAPWIALSYCWGGDSDFIFNDSRKDALKSGIPLEEFPATLRDAILITRRLGYQYVWIDALCIKQDSAEDWAIEAGKMKDVYSGAVLSIIAANSPSTRTGIFAQRSEVSRCTLEWKDSKRNAQAPATVVYLRPGNQLWDHSLQTSILMTRGWTLQEGILAPRTLSFGSQQMIWECCTHQADEGGRITKPTEKYRSKSLIQKLIKFGDRQGQKRQLSILADSILQLFGQDKLYQAVSRSKPYDNWSDIVTEFTTRSLTKDTDMLPALSGIASVFQPMLNDTYVAGMWRKRLLANLSWRCSARYPEDGSIRFVLAKNSEYLAPSWSWAGFPGRTVMPSSLERQPHGTRRPAEVLSVSTCLQGPDPFGKIKGGTLILRAPFCTLQFVPPIHCIEDEWPVDISKDLPIDSDFQKHLYARFCDIDTIAYEYYQQHVSCPDQQFAVLELDYLHRTQTFTLLVLESTGSEGEAWRRIAITTLRKQDVPSWAEGSIRVFMETENVAHDEVVAAKWHKRTITMV